MSLADFSADRNGSAGLSFVQLLKQAHQRNKAEAAEAQSRQVQPLPPGALPPRHLIWVMGDIASGQTTVLRESLKSFENNERNFGAGFYHDLPEWNGALIGCNDRMPEQYGIGHPGRFKTDSNLRWSNHDGWMEEQAIEFLEGPFTYLFAEGYYLGMEFANQATLRGWMIHSYWIDLPRQVILERRAGRPEPRYKQQNVERRKVAELLGATHINGNQQMEGVIADFLEQLVQDLNFA